MKTKMFHFFICVIFSKYITFFKKMTPPIIKNIQQFFFTNYKNGPKK